MVADDRRMAYRPTVLQAAAASSLRTMLEERDIEALVRPKGSPFTVSDIPLLDEAMELLGPDPKAVARQKALDAKRAEEEQFAQDTLAQAGIGSGIVTSQMLVDNINGMDAELTAQRAAADREWTYGISLSMKLRNSPPWIGACSSAVARRVRSPLWAMLRKPPHWAAPVRGGV